MAPANRMKDRPRTKLPGEDSNDRAPAGRLILGNLDAELDFARLERPDAPREGLSRKVSRTVAAFSTLLRAFAREDDEVRTLVPVAPDDVADVPGLPRPRLSSGPLGEVREAVPVLAWAETEEVAAYRSGGGGGAPEGRLPEAPLHELLWLLPAPGAAAAAAVNDRAFCLEAARELGCALPGSRMIHSISELASLPASEPWVVKARFSAAGRGRYVHRGGEGTVAPQSRQTVERLLRRHGSLLFEPWMERTADFGCAALATADETRIVGFHRQLVDRRGQFRGLELETAFAGFAALSGGEAATLERTVEAVAWRLAKAGYAGPFGIDCWRYRRPDGRVAFHPLGEVNARLTFGLVARALVDRIAGPLHLRREGHVRLGLARRTPLSSADSGQTVTCPSLTWLVHARAGGSAWLEVSTEDPTGSTALPFSTPNRR